MDVAVQDKTETLSEAVGAKLRELRKAKGKTLQDVATLCKTTPQTICRLEASAMTISVDWIERICTALGEDPRSMFSSPSIRDAYAMRAQIDMTLTVMNRFSSGLDDYLKGERRS
jgi:transcriptional regulator with XRE-family HTH domain